MIKVKFLKSPTGRFALGYSAGEVGFVPASIIAELQKEGYAVLVEEKKVETATAKPVFETAQKKRK